MHLSHKQKESKVYYYKNYGEIILNKELEESIVEIKKSFRESYTLAKANTSQMVIDSTKALEEIEKECDKKDIAREKEQQEFRKQLVEEGDVEALEVVDRNSKMYDKLLNR